jgi:D-glycero-D-manno-heptose 1,7-bisphosphate phosphatase
MRMRTRPATVSSPANTDRDYTPPKWIGNASEKVSRRFRGVLLDRDGVLNSLVYHQEAGVIDSPFTRAQFHLLPRVPAAIRLLNAMGLRVAIVSNQPGIAKGHLKPKTLEWFNRTLIAQVRAAGGHIDAMCYCLHHPQAIVPSLRRRCQCRKPRDFATLNWPLLIV